MKINYNVINHLSDEHGALSLNGYAAFHLELFKKGITKAAVTRSYFVKNLLEQHGIPAFCIMPIRVTVRNIFKRNFNSIPYKKTPGRPDCRAGIQLQSSGR